ncbi:substrate-binding domain-containing protein (plasmid) [Bacillus sp. CMF21]|uniref:substrate-binding domain-containing protein n=1 Tax=Metabacillus dongyingensis TaxID=2874282 RepID=UPI001FB1D3C3|nr:substrate-binding domain-containing protein [Metabacillus dongyingensis]UNJ81170.1 Transcriptional regulator, LacI family [Metabacillus dongyingensis]USK31549.1 substrate-binding domain-containing protein [Bacillus sp. CMF21]
MKKKVTMQDIADHLNISKNSVSQALTGKPGVSEVTRRLVQDTANELGYDYSNSRKQKLAEKKMTRNIALIASDYAFSLKSFFGEIYLSSEKEVRARGMNLFIEPIDSESKKNLTLPSVLSSHEIDGILILSHISTEYISKIISTGIPTVLIDHHSPYLQADSILTNNRFGAFMAVEHLIQLGHRDIAFVGNVDISPSYQERLEGYLLALRRYGIKPNENFMLTNTQENQAEISLFLDNLQDQPSAWFCVNDGHGFLVSSVLQQRGFKVPENVSICSFDNGQLSQILTPRITTMDIDLSYYGKKAVEQLCWRMENKEEPIQEILLPTKLIIRESTSEKR